MVEITTGRREGGEAGGGGGGRKILAVQYKIYPFFWRKVRLV